MNTATRFPALLETFFNNRLIQQRQASLHTIASYRDSFRLLVKYAQRRLKKAPSDLAMEDLDAPFLGAFLNYLEKERGNSALMQRDLLSKVRYFSARLAGFKR